MESGNKEAVLGIVEKVAAHRRMVAAQNQALRIKMAGCVLRMHAIDAELAKYNMNQLHKSAAVGAHKSERMKVAALIRQRELEKQAFLEKFAFSASRVGRGLGKFYTGGGEQLASDIGTGVSGLINSMPGPSDVMNAGRAIADKVPSLAYAGAKALPKATARSLGKGMQNAGDAIIRGGNALQDASQRLRHSGTRARFLSPLLYGASQLMGAKGNSTRPAAAAGAGAGNLAARGPLGLAPTPPSPAPAVGAGAGNLAARGPLGLALDSGLQAHQAYQNRPTAGLPQRPAPPTARKGFGQFSPGY